MHLKTRAALLIALAPNLACPMIHIAGEQAESASSTTSGASTTTTSSISTALSTSGSTSGAEGGDFSSSSTGHEGLETTTTSAASTTHTTTGDPPPKCPEIDPALAEVEGGPCKDEDLVMDGEVLQNSENCDNDCTVPECGDSVFNPKAGEVCDDGRALNDQDGSFCTKKCKERGLLAFVTSKGDFTGKIEKEGYEPGVLAADAYCAEAASSIPEVAATANSLVLSWLSAEKDGVTTSPKSRFQPCSESYFLPRADGSNERLIIAKDFTNLTTPAPPLFIALKNPISTTEFGDFVGKHTISITGTNGDGNRDISGDCEGYTSEEGVVAHGRPSDVWLSWSNSIEYWSCTTPSHLYCFEQCPPPP